jgi:hypothetical protein
VVLGHPEWREDPRFRDQQRAHGQPVGADRRHGRGAAHPHKEAWIAAFDAAGVPVGPVHTIGEALNHPQTLARGMVVDLEHPQAGDEGAGLPDPFFEATPTASTAMRRCWASTRASCCARYGYSEEAGLPRSTAHLWSASKVPSGLTPPPDATSRASTLSAPVNAGQFAGTSPPLFGFARLREIGPVARHRGLQLAPLGIAQIPQVVQVLQVVRVRRALREAQVVLAVGHTDRWKRGLVAEFVHVDRVFCVAMRCEVRRAGQEKPRSVARLDAARLGCKAGLLP